MARVEPPVVVPEPPTYLNLSHVPDKTLEGAVEWLRRLGIDVTERWLKGQTEHGDLVCRIVSGRRHYSTAELWRFITTRPSRTRGAARYAGKTHQQKGKTA